MKTVSISESSRLILYGVFRFFQGVTSTLYPLAVVYVIEIIGPSYRLAANSLVYAVYIIGQLIILLIAFFIRDFEVFFVYVAIVLSLISFYFW
jgi:hypothetical protein